MQTSDSRIRIAFIGQAERLVGECHDGMAVFLPANDAVGKVAHLAETDLIDQRIAETGGAVACPAIEHHRHIRA